jgi:cysteine-rich repeat protein
LVEQCDDGNDTDGDGCDNNCTDTACGNDVLTGDELCDDGNDIDGDGCDNNCTETGCGNSVVTFGETCDDGNDVSGDGCDNNCTATACGNGALSPGEECDTGLPEATILTLTADNCQVVEHEDITGDDRGGIAIGGGRLLYRGDRATASFDRQTLEGDRLDYSLDTLVSDHQRDMLFALGYGGEPLGNGGGSADSLLLMDPMTGLVGGGFELSQELYVTYGTGIFSGSGFVVYFYEGTAYEIDTSTGEVSTHSTDYGFGHAGCETWAHWGVAEHIDGELNLAYANGDRIERFRLSDGNIETIAEFPDGLGDMCSFTIAPNENRWYFHFEGTSMFRSGDESIGYCDATFRVGAVAGSGCDDDCHIVEGYYCDEELPSVCATECGDLIAAGEEECDEDDGIEGDGCDSNCTVTACGNGIVTEGEVCDDGNAENGDGCDDNCTVSACGNGAVAWNEECDDGGDIDGDGCDSNCTATGCGNGVATDGEACDDGNGGEGDGCDSNCTLSACGNGVRGGDEACDTGVASPLCTAECTMPCGVSEGAYRARLEGDTCYALFADYQTFDAAQAICVSHGGHLAVPTSAEENAWLGSIRFAGNWTWIGIHDQNVEANTDGSLFETVTGEPNSFYGWAGGEPNGGTSENCAHQWDGDTWNDVGCGQSLNFFCELPMDTDQGDGGTPDVDGGTPDADGRIPNR